MNSVYLHSGEKESSLVKIILLLLIPFFLYGFYKNGIYLYHKQLISLFMMFKPLILLIISVFISLIFSLIKKKEFVSYTLLYNILISMIVMPNINILGYLGCLIVLNILLCFINYNEVAVFMIVVFVIELLFKNYTFLNFFESSVEHKYSLIDYLIGAGPGGISNTFWIFSLISLVILCIKYNYKKYIPLTSLTVYYLLLIIYSFINGNLDLDLFMNNNFIFAIIFIAPLTMFTPYTKGGCYLYGILLGILSFATIFLDLNIGIYFVILLLSLGYKLFDKIFVGSKK